MGVCAGANKIVRPTADGRSKRVNYDSLSSMGPKCGCVRTRLDCSSRGSSDQMLRLASVDYATELQSIQALRHKWRQFFTQSFKISFQLLMGFGEH